MSKRNGLAIAAGFSLLFFALPAFARAPRVIDDNDRVTLGGNVHYNARPDLEVGAADPALPMERIIISLQIPAARQAELDRLLSEQQDVNSPNFRRWLTPEEFADRFGPDQEDLAALKGWLTSRGFTIDEIPKGRTSINFSGTVATVERAFRTSIRKYLVDGKVRHANARDPEIPRGLAELVGGIVSLHDFPRAPMNSGIKAVPQGESQPNYTVSPTAHYLAPADFATIYNVKPLYSAGFDGTGQSIAIVGRTNPGSSDWSDFRAQMGLPAKAVEMIINGPDPGDQGAGENNEADLDVEWAGAVAKNATIKFVTSKSTYTTDGVDLSAQYIVNNDLAAVMSTSFGLCEALLGTAQNNFYNNLWKQAAAQGITSFVSSGDSGAAGCNLAGATTGTGLGVNGLASTPYNVAVGGTQFNDGSGGYWKTQNGSDYGSALGYIPEIAWNESGSYSGGSGLWATGSGVSNLYAKPSWQAAPGVPGDGKRGIPDVSLTAAGHVGYLVRTQGGLYSMSGTSASSPAFAGLMALIVQKTGQRQGNANVRFYQLGNAQYGGSGPAVFHDTTAGSSSVPGVTGYSCGTGYDLVTGLGSVDAYALAGAWEIPLAPLAIDSLNPLANGTVAVAYSAAVGVSGGVPPYAWSVTGGSLGAGLALAPSTGAVSGTPAGSGVFSFTVQVSDSVGASVAKTFSHAVSAAVCGNPPVRIAGAAPLFYPDFPAAYLVAAESAAIQLQALDFAADFLLDRDVRVSLTGGSDCGFTRNDSATGLLGRLKVKNGTAKIDKLRLK